MKVSISYPPIETEKGVPLLSQNRQFQYFNEPTYIYPMIPAYAATLLSRNGYEVTWDDGIAERLTYEEYLKRQDSQGPDLIAMESKAPAIKAHWKYIREFKERWPDTLVVLMGDHLTAFPRESLENSPVDYVITGGDYDFQLLSLVDHLSKGTPLKSGFWWRDKDGSIANNGQFLQNNDMSALPLIDRDLTKWWLYTKNGNFKHQPGTYTMVGRDCWWRNGGGCTFCSWTMLYKKFQVRSPESLLDEIEMLHNRYGIREVFDDTGTFPGGHWLKTFCQGMIDRGLAFKVRIGCNMRFGALREEDYKLMGKAGFRFILYGLESANQKTLNRLQKGTTNEEAWQTCKWAKRYGMDPHLTIMMGYPWETYEDARRTIEFTKKIFNAGYVKTLQATIVIPYPGTMLWNQCRDNGWLLTDDYEQYDMRQVVMKSELTNEQIKALTQDLYKVFLSPRYMLRTALSVRSKDDLAFAMRGVKYIYGHLRDFANGDKDKSNTSKLSKYDKLAG